MNKKTILIVVGVILAIVLVVGGVFVYKKWDENRNNAIAKYTNCVEEVEALEKKNQEIDTKVHGEIRQCIDNKLVEKGYTDGYDCSKERNNTENTVCNEESFVKTKLQESGYSDGVMCVQDLTNPICDTNRYNTEMDIRNQFSERSGIENWAYAWCSEDILAMLEAEGYEEGIPVSDCVKYLVE